MKKIFIIKRLHINVDSSWANLEDGLGIKVRPISKLKAGIEVRKATRKDIIKRIKKINQKKDTDFKLI